MHLRKVSMELGIPTIKLYADKIEVERPGPGVTRNIKMCVEPQRMQRNLSSISLPTIVQSLRQPNEVTSSDFDDMT